MPPSNTFPNPAIHSPALPPLFSSPHRLSQLLLRSGHSHPHLGQRLNDIIAVGHPPGGQLAEQHNPIVHHDLERPRLRHVLHQRRHDQENGDDDRHLILLEPIVPTWWLSAKSRNKVPDGITQKYARQQRQLDDLEGHAGVLRGGRDGIVLSPDSAAEVGIVGLEELLDLSEVPDHASGGAELDQDGVGLLLGGGGIGVGWNLRNRVCRRQDDTTAAATSTPAADGTPDEEAERPQHEEAGQGGKGGGGGAGPHRRC
mmetsp:Transcript_10400/g.24490  ORF Transcript_10400/g.24490 Transcript_10400/m.24490 type:complete len:257 (-) Transcript_10400:42-812(-)